MRADKLTKLRANSNVFKVVIQKISFMKITTALLAWIRRSSGGVPELKSFVSYS